MVHWKEHGTGSERTRASCTARRICFVLAVLGTLLRSTSTPARDPYLVATPSELVFHALAGADDPPPQTLTLTLSNADTTEWWAWGSSVALTLTPGYGYAPGEMAVRTHLLSRPAGLYRDTIWFTWWGDTLAPPPTLAVPVETRISPFPNSDSDFVRLLPEVLSISSPAVETTFALAVHIDLATTAGALAIPLRYAGHSALRVDTSVTYPPDHVGVSLGPAGRDPAWSITTSLLDPVHQTILLGFVSFSAVPPVTDTLAYLHFALDSSDSSARVWVDATSIGDNFLSVTDVNAVERMPGWSPAEIRIGYEPPPPSICVSTHQVDFEADAGGLLPSHRSISILGCDGSLLDWRISHTASWLSLSADSGGGVTSEVILSVNTTDLPTGLHADTLFVTSDAADNSPQMVVVSYRVNPAPVLVDSLYIFQDTTRIRGPYADTSFALAVWLANQRNLALVSVPLKLTGLPSLRLDSSAQYIDGHPGLLWGAAGDELMWTIRTIQVDDRERTFLFQFISFSAYPAYYPGSLVDLFFALDSSNAGGVATLDSTAVGAYHLSVADVQATHFTPAWRPGVIVVGDSLPSPQICLETDSLHFEGSALGALPPDQEITFQNCRSGEFPWTIQDNATWLTLSPTSGTGADVRVTAHVNTTQLPQGVHWAIVTLRNLAVPQDERFLRVSYRLNASDLRMYLWPGYLELPDDRDTTFAIPLVLHEGGDFNAVAISVPLTWDGAGSSVWLDTLVEDGFGNKGITQGPLGASPVWTIRTSLVHPVLHTVLLGYVSFGSGLAGPQNDTLAVLHFGLSAQPGTQLFTIDTTMIPPGNHLSISDVSAQEWPVEWNGATVTIGTTGLSEESDRPGAFALGQNVPNPFNAATTISIEVPAWASGANVSVTIYDVLGRRVRELVAGALPAGAYRGTWNGTDQRGKAVASGVYFIVLESQSPRLVKKAVLLR